MDKRRDGWDFNGLRFSVRVVLRFVRAGLKGQNPSKDFCKTFRKVLRTRQAFAPMAEMSLHGAALPSIRSSGVAVGPVPVARSCLEGDFRTGKVRMPAHDAQTLAFYTEFAVAYVASGHGGSSRHLPGFLAMLPAGAKVLELGCGSGRDARAMLDAGFRVDPTDGSAAIAERASELLQMPVRVMRFDELAAKAEYDAVWANASLLHVPCDELPAILAKVRTALKPGGLHHATFRTGEREGRDSHGRYFNHVTRLNLVEMYQSSGAWDVVSVCEYLGGSFDPGVQVRWIAVLARRAV